MKIAGAALRFVPGHRIKKGKGRESAPICDSRFVVLAMECLLVRCYFPEALVAGTLTAAIFSRFASCCSSFDSSSSRPFACPEAQICAK